MSNRGGDGLPLPPAPLRQGQLAPPAPPGLLGPPGQQDQQPQRGQGGPQRQPGPVQPGPNPAHVAAWLEQQRRQQGGQFAPPPAPPRSATGQAQQDRQPPPIPPRLTPEQLAALQNRLGQLRAVPQPGGGGGGGGPPPPRGGPPGGRQASNAASSDAGSSANSRSSSRRHQRTPAQQQSRNLQQNPLWPNNIQDWQRFRQSFANSPNKNFGGTRGDSAFINWALAILQIGGASTVIYFSHRFLVSYSEFKGKSAQNFTRAYYCCQYLLGLSILTTALLTLYVLWVFADGRHPMRKAWMAMGQERAGKGSDGKVIGFSRGFQDASGRDVPRPGMGTTSFETVNRFTTNRLFAEKKHVTKMLVLYLLLFVAWVAPFLIVTLADGYITWSRNKKNHNVNIAQICGIKKTSAICWDLAKAGITAGAVSLLLLFNVIATLIATVARPTLTTIPQNGPLAQYAAGQ